MCSGIDVQREIPWKIFNYRTVVENGPFSDNIRYWRKCLFKKKIVNIQFLRCATVHTEKQVTNSEKHFFQEIEAAKQFKRTTKICTTRKNDDKQ